MNSSSREQGQFSEQAPHVPQKVSNPRCSSAGATSVLPVLHWILWPFTLVQVLLNGLPPRQQHSNLPIQMWIQGNGTQGLGEATGLLLFSKPHPSRRLPNDFGFWSPIFWIVQLKHPHDQTAAKMVKHEMLLCCLGAAAPWGALTSLDSWALQVLLVKPTCFTEDAKVIMAIQTGSGVGEERQSNNKY